MRINHTIENISRGPNLRQAGHGGRPQASPGSAGAGDGTSPPAPGRFKVSKFDLLTYLGAVRCRAVPDQENLHRLPLTRNMLYFHHDLS